MSKLNLPRGLKNNNPGNIRINSDHFQGEIKPSRDKAFKQFETMPYGYRAMLKMLQNYKKNRGCKTIREMISRWAPESENNTKAYYTFVAEKVGISPDIEVDTFNKELMCNIAAAMSKIENGIDPDMSDITAGWNML